MTSHTTAVGRPGHLAVARLAGRTASNPGLRGLSGVLIALAAWEAASRTGLLDARFAPPPTLVLPRAATLLTEPDLLDGLWLTVTTWLAGLAIATAIAISVGAVLGATPALERAARPLIETARPIPAVALLPVVTLLAGMDAGNRTGLVAFASSWPILLNTIAGVRACDPALLDMARLHGHRRTSILATVRLPAAAPLIATGLRISTAIALIATISLELVTGTDEGLGGYLALVAAGGNDPAAALGVTVLAGLLGLAINSATAAAERRVFAWHPAHIRAAS